MTKRCRATYNGIPGVRLRCVREQGHAQGTTVHKFEEVDGQTRVRLYWGHIGDDAWLHWRPDAPRVGS